MRNYCIDIIFGISFRVIYYVKDLDFFFFFRFILGSKFLIELRKRSYAFKGNFEGMDVPSLDFGA